jgi:hypothetical protein
MENKQMQPVAATLHSTTPSVYSSESAFESAQRMAKQLASSTLVPKDYQGNVSNTLIALEMANRTGSSPMMVMQNLHIISGRPSWSSSFIIAALNSCGRFAPIRFRVEDRGEKTIDAFQTEWVKTSQGNQKQTKPIKVTVRDKSCVAYTVDQTGATLEGPEASIEMAVHEGWYTKSDSKWKTMPDLMLRYRAAAFFGRLYAPDVLMGMHTFEEVQDIGTSPIHTGTENPINILNAKVNPKEEATEEATVINEELQHDDEEIV